MSQAGVKRKIVPRNEEGVETNNNNNNNNVITKYIPEEPAIAINQIMISDNEIRNMNIN
jgi:hypothetical protein